MSAVVAILAFAVLFALAGTLRPKPSCGGECGACRGSCRLTESEDVER